MLFQPFAAKVPAIAGYAAGLDSPQFLGPLMPSSAFGNAMQAADEFMLVVDPQDPAAGRLAANVATQLENYGARPGATAIKQLLAAAPRRSVLDAQTVGEVREFLKGSVAKQFTRSLDDLAAGLGSGAHGVPISKSAKPSIHPAFEVGSLIRLTNKELVEVPVARAFASAMAMRLGENEKVIAEIPWLQISSLNAVIRSLLVGCMTMLAHDCGGETSAFIALIASAALLFLPPAVKIARGTRLRRAMGLGVLDLFDQSATRTERQALREEYEHYAATGKSLAATRAEMEAEKARRRCEMEAEEEYRRLDTGPRTV